MANKLPFFCANLFLTNIEQMFYNMFMQGNIMEKGKNETYKSNKIFLRVIADMSPNRLVFPQKIIWEDGREFIIQKVTDVRRQFVAEIGEHCTKY